GPYAPRHPPNALQHQKTINKKLKTKSFTLRKITQQTHKPKTKNQSPWHQRVCYKDAHAHYATTNHHTNTTTRKQEQNLAN
ncbi:hypothetical protein, partial [Actinotignum sp. GS-2025e]|uniref:hypothetical protein n=1 Tax=Actinotignum sp. GS-2025e TaxID=3427278 RepID=UPI003F45CFBA